MDAHHDTPSGLAVKKLCEGLSAILAKRSISGSRRSPSAICTTCGNPLAIGISGAQSRGLGPSVPPSANAGNRTLTGSPAFFASVPCIKGILTNTKASTTSMRWMRSRNSRGDSTVERISEAYFLPVLEQLLHAVPLLIRGFHSDHGSEYINGRVAVLLGKLLHRLHQISRPSDQRSCPSRK